MFGEPAWEMLLLLYALPSRQTITRLAELASASKSTAIRWIDYLESQRLIVREVHPTDNRAVFVDLTDKGREAIRLYLSGTAATGD
jgi:DNA-binding MarR family transcriptional regulator